ncbi:hypothetical protein ACFCWG_17360 [Streptomyces sp. NPDC056390]
MAGPSGLRAAEGAPAQWMSAARPGRTHDITAAHHDRILAHCVPPASAP